MDLLTLRVIVVASFEEDRKKVESMREKRGKFRPEQ